MDTLKQAHLARAADHLEDIQRSLDDLEAEVTDLFGDPKVRELANETAAKVARARRLMAEAEVSPSTRWTDYGQKLSNLIAELLIDVGCLRVATRQLAVADSVSITS